MVWNKFSKDGYDQLWLSEPEYIDYLDRNRVFTGLAAFVTAGANLTNGHSPVRVTTASVTPNLFRVLGVDAALGRTFADDEGQASGRRVILLSHGFWTEKLGRDPNVVGSSLELDGVRFEVIGVMPPMLRFPNEAVESLDSQSSSRW